MNHLLTESHDEYLARMERHNEKEHCSYCLGLFDKDELKGGRCEPCIQYLNDILKEISE